MTEPIKPNKFPRWASDNIKNKINNESNVYEPPDQKKDIGWDLNEVPPRQWFNWLARLTHDWLVYFEYYLNRPQIYLKAKLPDPTKCKAKMIFVSDEGEGVLAFSDGVNWKKINITGNI